MKCEITRGLVTTSRGIVQCVLYDMLRNDMFSSQNGHDLNYFQRS